MEVRDMIADVARAKNDLAGLQSDANVTPARLAKCSSVMADLETGVAELLGTTWIPQTSSELIAAIYCVKENLRRLQSEIDDALDVNVDPNIFDRALPDELFRVWMAMTFGRLLEFQLDVLMNALAKVMPQSQMVN